ncbi:MAG: M20/M25/M40 family metallo-hydrolase [Erysipelotrichaceae bacterium]|nr:M20/M25/M40 family metallo-hydrolase [Erysipelotrichaceae bacterium]
MNINKDRIVHEFLELTNIDSESFHERKMADVLIDRLKELGFDVIEDDAYKHYNSEAGNIYGYLKGKLDKPSILLSAHMDTVSPGNNKYPIVDGNIIKSDGSTVLGADDVAGLVEILEGIRYVQEKNLPHRDIEILFPIAEEQYDKGTQIFDFSQIKSRQAYVLDLSGDIGIAAIKAPSILSFEIKVIGQASHAGFDPENGIHAIYIASQAISKLKLGHIDEESTLNIGTIQGGIARNIVPEETICLGEIRSYDHVKAMKYLKEVEDIFNETAKKYHGKIKMNYEVHMEAYENDMNSDTVKDFISACQYIGINAKFCHTFGGSDNNHFMENGIEGLVISSAMYNVHSTNEYTKIDELVKGATLVAALISQ